MKAVILNSGTGSRMGALTENAPKCFAPLDDSETAVIDRQMEMLLESGIEEIVITTGPFPGMIRDRISRKFPAAAVTYVENPSYAHTNYIYSLYLARDKLEGPILLLHGDLVFERSVLRDVLNSRGSAVVCDASLPLPEKDFKAVLNGNRVEKIGIYCFENARACQPLYHLEERDWAVWKGEIIQFCEQGRTGVYAEEAFNEVSDRCAVYALEAGGRICTEVDTPEDLQRVRQCLCKNGGTI